MKNSHGICKLLCAGLLCTLLLCLAGMALAEEAVTYGDLWIGDEQFTSEKMTIAGSDGGTATLSVVDGEYTLTLNGFKLTGAEHAFNTEAASIYYVGEKALNLVLNGESSITSIGSPKDNGSYGICCRPGGINMMGDGSLTVTSGEAVHASYGVSASGDITVSGTASLTGISGNSIGTDGVYTSNHITVTDGGSLTGIGGNGTSYGVFAYESITVEKTGSLTGIGGMAAYSSVGVCVPTGIITVRDDGSLTATGREADFNSYGVYTTNGSTTVSGGVLEAQGETNALNKNPTIDASFTGAKVWYGNTKAEADNAGAKDPTDLLDQKYVRIEVAAFYSVSVETDGNGTASADKTGGETGTAVTLTATPNPGYQFKEWQVISGGVTITDSQLTIGSEDIQIKAVFEPIAYTVSFNANGGAGTMAPQTFTAGAAQSLTPNRFTRNGFTFTGWNTAADGSGTAYADGAVVTASSDMILYAQWEAIAAPVLPKTGDSSNPMLWLAVCLLSAAGLLLLRKKKFS